jgi:hypothetical protein
MFLPHNALSLVAVKALDPQAMVSPAFTAPTDLQLGTRRCEEETLYGYKGMQLLTVQRRLHLGSERNRVLHSRHGTDAVPLTVALGRMKQAIRV